MTTLARNEIRTQLRYQFTLDERIALGIALATAFQRKEQEEANLDRIKADFKAKLATIDAEIETTSTKVSSGYELREYVCFWTYDEPTRGQKTLRRREPPHDVIRTEEMTEADRQTVIQSIDEQAAGTQGEIDQVQQLCTSLTELGDDMAAVSEEINRIVSEEDPKIAIRVALKLEADGRNLLVDAFALNPDFRAFAGAVLDAQRNAKPKKARATSSGGVVGTAEDGDVNTPDEDRRHS